MKILFLMALPAFLICRMPEAVAADRGDILPHVEGWSLAIAPGDTVYTSQNLWDIIDGAADLFLSYGFIDLHIGEYTNSSGLDVRVELYRHNSRENAFGIYSQERNPGYHFIDIGTQGYVEEKVLNFFCGIYYVKISTHRGGPEGDSAMVSIGRRVVEHLHQERSWPGSLALFPDEGKIHDSEAFVAENFLGYSFLHSAYTARYESGGLLFIIGCDSASQARRLAESYLHSLHLRADTLGTGMLDVSDPHHGRVVLLLQERFFCGAIGGGDRERSHRRLALLRTRLADMGRATGRVDLPRQWRFLTGDDPRYLMPEYDDSGWKSIRVGEYWENQGYERYDGVAWYRVTTTVPSALRSVVSIGDALLICLGKIDDYDSVYFNGTRIGHTELYSATRKYLVPFNIIHWDRENTIAVRVDDIGGYGGMNEGPYYIKAAGIPDVMRIRADETPVEIDSPSTAPISRSIRFELLRPVTCVLETRFPETGQVRIVVDPVSSARFAVALRVPSWCRRFKALVSGRTYRGRPGRYLVIERMWKKNSVINVECELTTHVLGGGNSYRNCIAIKRGPQVLAVDAGLNPGLKHLDEVRIDARKVHVQSSGSKLPAMWVGNQIYSLKAKNDQGRLVAITLVPFADAGQEGGNVRVWLKKE